MKGRENNLSTKTGFEPRTFSRQALLPSVLLAGPDGKPVVHLYLITLRTHAQQGVKQSVCLLSVVSTKITRSQDLGI